MPSRSRTRALEDHARAALITLEHLLAPSEIKGRGTRLADLLYRAEITNLPDGMRSVIPEAATSGGHVTDVTATAALARLSDVCGQCDGGSRTLADGRVVACKTCGGTGRRFRDPMGEAVRDLVDNLGVLCRAAEIVERRQGLIFVSARERVGRESSLQGVCCVPACARVVSGSPSDRLKRGYCPRCYLRFCSWRITHRTEDDRGAFASFMAQRLSEQKLSAQKL